MKGRHRRRTHGEKKDNTKGQDQRRGAPQLHPIKFLVDVYGEHPIRADFYSTRLRPGLGDFWELKDSKDMARSAGGSFAATNIKKAALWLNDGILVDFVDLRLVGPQLRIGHGGDFLAGERGWQGGSVVFDEGMRVQELSPAFVMKGYRIRVERLADDGDYYQFHVLVDPGF